VNSVWRLLSVVAIGGVLLSSPVQSDEMRMVRIGVLTPAENGAAEEIPSPSRSCCV